MATTPFQKFVKKHSGLAAANQKQKLYKRFVLIFLTFFTAVLLSLLAVSLPYTERYIENVNYDIDKADNYWKNTYILEAADENQELSQENLQKVKSIIERRFRKFKVENWNINIKDSTLAVTVQSNKDPFHITSLISSHNQVSLATAKPEVDFNSPENQIARYLPENYDDTKINRDFFRTVAVKPLPTQAGEQSYFTLFKPLPWNAREFKDFLQANYQKQIGIKIDETVFPYTISDNQNDPIALGLTPDTAEAQVYRVIFNSGTYPVKLTLKDTIEEISQTVEFDYFTVILSFIFATVLSSIILYFLGRSTTPVRLALSNFVSIGFVMCLWRS